MNIESRQSGEVIAKRAMHSNVVAIIMASGEGKRLRQITQGAIPKNYVTIDKEQKIRGIDHTLAALQSVNVSDIIISANQFLELYRRDLGSEGYTYYCSNPSDGTGLHLYKIIQDFALRCQCLILPSDEYFSARDLRTLMEQHVLRTVSHAVANLRYPEMSGYYTKVVERSSDSIVGEVGSKYLRSPILPSWCIYVTSAITLIDAGIYQDVFAQYMRLCRKPTDIDLWRDVTDFLAEKNRRRIMRGRASMYNARLFKYPLIDFGTPERLELTRREYRALSELGS